MNRPSEVASILVADDLVKTFRGSPAIANISFSIQSGQVLGYLGPNGSGKSTTVKVLAGLLDPSQGRVLYRGASIKSDPMKYKSRLGYVPEEAHLYEFLSGWEYLEMVASLREIETAQFRNKAEALLSGFGLYPQRHARIAGYSKGMRQRIILIAALIHDPEVLILDEPFSGLDITNSTILCDVLRILSQRGKAIFFCSPVLDMFEKICTHMIVLRKGKMTAYGSFHDIAAEFSAPATKEGFLQLAIDVDVPKIAANIIAAIEAPCS